MSEQFLISNASTFSHVVHIYMIINVIIKLPQIDVAGHKLSSAGHNEDSEILRVPIALAMTKLLLSLPENSLHTHLPRLSGHTYYMFISLVYSIVCC